MTHPLKTTIKFAAVAIAAALSSTAFAQSAGDNIVNVGWYHIAPQDSSTPLTITSPAPVATTLAGSGATVEKADTLGFSLTHFFTNNWAGSLDLGIPPTYKIKGTGTLAAVGEIGEAKQWAPTILGKYFFFESTSAFRPFLGLGASRVSYKDIKLTSTFQGAVDGTLALMSQGQVQAGATSASLDSSWAPVYNIGASYAINKDWYASFSISYLGLKTKAELTTASNIGPITSTTSIKIDPIVTFASIGYRF
jgi:outer membrane protein